MIIIADNSSLLTFLCNFTPNIKLIGIEIDINILDIVRSYFGLPIDDY